MNEEQFIPPVTYRRTSTPIPCRKVLPSGSRDLEERNYQKWVGQLNTAPEVFRIEGFNGHRYIIPGIVAGHLVFNKKFSRKPKPRIESKPKEEITESPHIEDKNKEQLDKLEKTGKFTNLASVKWVKENFNCYRRNKQSLKPSGV